MMRLIGLALGWLLLAAIPPVWTRRASVDTLLSDMD